MNASFLSLETRSPTAPASSQTDAMLQFLPLKKSSSNRKQRNPQFIAHLITFFSNITYSNSHLLFTFWCATNVFVWALVFKPACALTVCVFHSPHNPRHLSPCQLLYSGTCLLHTPFVNFAFVLLPSDHWSSHSSWEDSQAPSRTREWLTILGRKLSTRCCSKGEVATFRPPSQCAKSSLLWHASAPLVSWVGSTGSLLRLPVVQ